MSRYVSIAYKKLKASVYFDKTLLPLQGKIVKFEDKNIGKKLKKLTEKLDGGDKAWDEYAQRILKEIDVLVYPKKLYNSKEDDEQKKYKSKIIINKNNELLKIKRPKYFIDLPVEGHIISVLWVLFIGRILDDRNNPDNMLMYEHSYGNRLKKTLINPKTNDITYSPYLFEPYFSQYESWRDKALEVAKKNLNDNKDVIMISLDFKNFFYSVDINKDEYEKILCNYIGNYERWHKRIHDFIYIVLQEYSNKLRKLNTDQDLDIADKTFLPIGFYPSYILANWVLTPFDKEVIKRCNPVYYGRYVDDIIMVDKVEKNSPLREIISDSDEEDKLTTQKIVEYYFENCPADRINPSTCKYKALIAAKEGSSEADGRIYCVNKEMFNESNTDIKIQDEKFKVFYFHQDGHMALLDNFLMHIAKNASEFRYLPDMDDILNKKDYTELFTLVYDGSIYKLRDVTKVRMDKYTLSKFLGKYRKVGAMIQDFKEIVFEKNILTILDKHILIENYTLWDRLLEIYIVNDRLDYYEEMAVKLFDAILELDYPDTIVNNKSNPQKALILFLHTAICRTTALRWGKEINETISKIIKKATKKAEEKVEDSSIKRLILKLLTIKTIEKMRLNFCKTRMINKYVTLIPIDFIKLKTIKTTEESIRLYKLEDVISHMRDDNKDDNNGDENLEDYIYHPYMVTPQEISYALACYDISKGRRMDPSYQFNKLTELYLKWNYCKDNKSESDDESPVFKDIDIYKFNNDSIIKNRDRDRYIISVKNDNLEKLKVAIGNARINTADFQNTLIGKPNRSLKRYQKLSELLHTAVSENVDLLVLPENYLPLEWIPDIARLCANNQIALVTGIEHVIFPKNIKGKHRVYNLTAVILPYRVEEYKYAYVIYHHKVNYSPEEKRIIAGYRYEPFEGDSFHLFYWSDIWFSVYCCYELASIQGRSVFGSLPDALIAVEWNKDVAYFSSIVESLSRDLHCYCIQANSSDYGDSRVILPSSMVMRDLIKTKGGINSAVLIDEINIKKLREFQLKEYELQKEDGSFKPTPPDFNHDIPKYKLNGELLDYMENNGIIKSMRKTCCNS